MEQSKPPSSPRLTVENRVDSAIVTVIVTTYRDGRPVSERTMKPVKVFRAAHPDLWTAIDTELNGPGQDRDS